MCPDGLHHHHHLPPICPTFAHYIQLHRHFPLVTHIISTISKWKAGIMKKVCTASPSTPLHPPWLCDPLLCSTPDATPWNCGQHAWDVLFNSSTIRQCVSPAFGTNADHKCPSFTFSGLQALHPHWYSSPSPCTGLVCLPLPSSSYWWHSPKARTHSSVPQLSHWNCPNWYLSGCPWQHCPWSQCPPTSPTHEYANASPHHGRPAGL